MSKQNLFVPKVKNHVSRNAFDLSQRRIFSSKCGEILPCLVQDCLPGDKFKVKANSFVRTAPLNTASFARLKQYYNFYFVPYRLLYRDFPSFVVSQSKSSKSAVGISSDSSVPSTLPYVESQSLFSMFKWDVFGYNGSHSYSIPNFYNTKLSGVINYVGLSRMVQAKKLLQYLGYYRVTSVKSADNVLNGGNSNTRLSLFPLLAYQKVYNDFYRFSQWENEQPYTYNLDYMAGRSDLHIPISDLFGSVPGTDVPCFKDDIPTMFDMRYVNLTKDSFYGVVPNSQFGAVSTVDTFDFDEFKSSTLYLKSNTAAVGDFAGFDKNSRLGFISEQDNEVKTTSMSLVDYHGNDIFKKYGRFDILALRAAQAKQKFLEVTLSNNSDYKSQIEAHFNVKVSSLMSGLCDYIGGFSADLSLDPVSNSNLSDTQSIQTTNSANYSAIATMQGDGSFEFEAREHGLIIGVTYTLPFVDYNVVGYDFPILRTEFDDFALPEFDKLGYEEVDPRFLIGSTRGINNSLCHLGYGPRYYDYKTNIDIVLGDFNVSQNGTQPQFVVSPNSNMNDVLSMKIFRDNPFTPVTFGLYYDLMFNRVGAWSFKAYPQLLNNIFSVSCGILLDSDNKHLTFHDDTSFDQFYNCVNFNIQVIRNLDRLGLPY